MEQAIQKINSIMNAHFQQASVPQDYIAYQSKALAEVIVEIFGADTILKMDDAEISKLSILIENGYSIGFRAGYHHAKKPLDNERSR